MSRPAACPGRDDLERFLLGQTSEDEAGPLESHLACCDDCLRMAQTLTAQDALTETVRSRLAAGDEPESPALRTLIAHLQELSRNGAGQATAAACPPPPGAAPPAPAAPGPGKLDFLCPPAGPDELGRLGPYRVLRVLGRGGMGVVLEAEDPRLHRGVALKAMLPGLAGDPAARERFLREGRAAGAIEHDHIVSIYQVCDDGPVPFLVMPLLRGESLEDRLRRERRLPLTEALRIAGEVAEGLAAAHARGLIHRDIKPGNLWLEGERGRVKILDFGLVRPAADTAHLTHTGVIVGTPAYMAPEQARGAAVDARCDLFSLGCVLYRMTTGSLPFKGSDPWAALSSLALDDPPPAASLNPALPPAVSDLIARLLAKDPAARPPTAAVVAETVAALQAAPPDATAAATLAPHQPPAGARAPRERGGRRRRLAALAAVLLAVFGPLAYFCGPALFRAGHTDDGPAHEAKGLGMTLERVLTGHTRVVSGAVFAPDGRRAWSCSPDATVRLWDLEAGKQVGAPWDLVRSPFRIVFTPDGRRVAFGYGRTWYLWQFEPREQLRHFDIKGDQVRCAAFSLAGRRLLTASSAQAGGSHAQVWDTGTGRELRAFTESAPGVRCVALSPLGTVALWADRDGVHLADVATGRRRWRLAGARAGSAAFSPDGNLILLGGPGGELSVHEAATGRQLHRLRGHAGDVRAVAFSPDGRRCLSGGAGGSLRLWGAAAGQELACARHPAGGIAAVAFSPDGSRALSAGDDLTVRLWELPPAPAEELRKVRTLAGHGNVILGLAFSPDGAWLASASRDGSVGVWDTDGGRPLHFLKGPGGPVGGVACSPQGLLAAAIENGPVQLWDPVRGELLATLGGPGGHFLQVAFSPDGRWLAGSRPDGRVVIWDAASRAERQTLAGHAGPVRALAFSPDGRCLAGGADDGVVMLWDVTTGGLPHTLAGHARRVRSLAFSRDGKRLASASFDGTVKFWDPTAGRELFALRGHSGEVEAVAFGPAGLLASGSSDRSVRFWDAASGKALQTLELDENIYALAFSPDGRLLALGGADRAISLWTVPAELGRPRTR